MQAYLEKNVKTSNIPVLVSRPKQVGPPYNRSFAVTMSRKKDTQSLNLGEPKLGLVLPIYSMTPFATAPLTISPLLPGFAILQSLNSVNSRITGDNLAYKVFFGTVLK